MPYKTAQRFTFSSLEGRYFNLEDYQYVTCLNSEQAFTESLKDKIFQCLITLLGLHVFAFELNLNLASLSE